MIAGQPEIAVRQGHAVFEFGEDHRQVRREEGLARAALPTRNRDAHGFLGSRAFVGPSAEHATEQPPSTRAET